MDNTSPANPALERDITVLTGGLSRLTALAGEAMDNATMALLRADLPLAQRVIDEGARIDALRHELDDQALALLATHPRTVTQTRMIDASLRVSGYVTRMADVARHIAETARRRHPRPAIPPLLRTTVEQMSEVAHQLTARTATVIAQRDGRAALAAVESAHRDRMSRLHDELFQQLLYGLRRHRDGEVAQDVAMLGRYFERYAEHAVAVTRRIAHVAACADASGAASGATPGGRLGTAGGTLVDVSLIPDCTPDYDPDFDIDPDYARAVAV